MWENKIILCATNQLLNKSIRNHNKLGDHGKRAPNISNYWLRWRSNHFMTMACFLTRKMRWIWVTLTWKNSRPYTTRSFYRTRAIRYTPVVMEDLNLVSRHGTKGTEINLRATIIISFHILDWGLSSIIQIGPNSIFWNLLGRK